MKIKLLSIMAGPDGCHDAGSVLDLPEAQARTLVDGGFAEAVDPPHVRGPAPHPAAHPAKAELPHAGETADLPHKPRAK